MKLRHILLIGAISVSAPLPHAEVVTNGAFESGFGGWTDDSGTDSWNAPITLQFNSTSGILQGTFGESVPAPVNGGTAGAYFYSDAASQSISQESSLLANTSYNLSFDIYAPRYGRANPFDSSLFASLDGTAISSISAPTL